MTEKVLGFKVSHVLNQKETDGNAVVPQAAEFWVKIIKEKLVLKNE